jgi:DNA-binding IclR family transcriptional regulator
MPAQRLMDEMSQADVRNDGTQAIRRAASILRLISKNPRPGATLREISESVRLSRSTTHRILKCLVDEQLLAQSEDAKRYTIGDLTAELGLASGKWQGATLRWRSVLESLATDTGATIYLMGRSGIESVCLDKAEGTAVVRVIPVEVGQRRPLGVGAGAAAILAAMPDAERESAIRSIEPHLCRYSTLTGAALRQIIQNARSSGFAESLGQVAEGVYGLGVSIPDARGSAMLALSLATHQSIATPDKIKEWKLLLRRAIR